MADSTVVSPSAVGVEAGQATVIDSTIIAENPLDVGTATATHALRGRSVKAQTAAGTHRITVGALFRRSLGRGRCVLKITATGAAGNVSRTYRLTFRLR